MLVVSVGLEPSLDDLPADDAPLLLTELYAEQFDEIVDSPRILKLWDGNPTARPHVRKPTADEAARWYASFLDRENETHQSISDEDKDYDSKGGGIPWPWRTEDDWECPLLGTCHPVSMAALTLKFAPMQNGPTVRNQLRRCTYSGDSPSKYHLVIAPGGPHRRARRIARGPDRNRSPPDCAGAAAKAVWLRIGIVEKRRPSETSIAWPEPATAHLMRVGFLHDPRAHVR